MALCFRLIMSNDSSVCFRLRKIVKYKESSLVWLSTIPSGPHHFINMILLYYIVYCHVNEHLSFMSHRHA